MTDPVTPTETPKIEPDEPEHVGSDAEHPTPEPKTGTRAAMGFYKTIMPALIAGFLGGMLVLAIQAFNTHVPPRFAVLNLEDIVEQHIVDIAKRNLDDAQKQAVSTQFSHALEKKVMQLIEEENLVLLNQRAVISDLPDYTGYIENKLKEPDDY